MTRVLPTLRSLFMVSRKPLSPHSRRARQRTLLLAVAVFWGVTAGLLHQLAQDAQQSATSTMRRYTEVMALSRELLAAKTNLSPLATTPPMQAIQQIAATLGIQDQLANIRPGMSEDVPTVELRLEGLDLTSMVSLLWQMQREARLKIIACTVERQEFGPNVVNLQLVLAR